MMHALLALMLIAGLVSGQDKPAISLVDSNLRVTPGADPRPGSLLIKAEKFADAAKCSPAVTDWMGDSTPGFKVEFVDKPEAAGGAATAYWLAKANVSGLPVNTTLQRYLRFQCGAETAVLSYTVTNRAKGTFTWAVTAPGKPVNLRTDRAVALPIGVTGDEPATNIRLVASTLYDDSSGTRLGVQNLELCAAAEGACAGAGLMAPSRRMTTLYLRVRDAFDRRGQFKGNVAIAADQAAEAASFELTVNSTSTWAWLGGLVCLLVGLAIAWYVTVYARGVTARAQALLPASELAETVSRLIHELEEALIGMGAQARELKARLENLSREISETTLDAKGLLPPKLPNPFRSSQGENAKLKEFLDAKAAEIAIRVVLVGGIKKAGDEFKPGLTPQAETEIRTAVETISKLVETVKTEAEAATQTATALQQMQQALAPLRARGVVPGAAPPAPVVAIPSRKELLIEVARHSAYIWVIWAFLNVAVGFVAMVLTNPGFGVPLDYFKCVFWGLGVQVAGQQLQQLSPTSAPTALGISTPKPG